MFAWNYLLSTYAQRLLTNETVGGITVVQIEVKIIYRFSHLARNPKMPQTTTCGYNWLQTAKSTIYGRSIGHASRMLSSHEKLKYIFGLFDKTA